MKSKEAKMIRQNPFFSDKKEKFFGRLYRHVVLLGVDYGGRVDQCG